METAFERFERLMRPSEAANVLRVSPATIRRMIADGRIESIRIGDAPHGHYRIPRSSVERIVHKPPGDDE
jgi:excisionase family DNA binding protein